MTEEEAQSWLNDTFGPEVFVKLDKFVALLLRESDRQSLIARSTFVNVWPRHIADSAQLALHVEEPGDWVDIGSGGGLPGIVVAAILKEPMLLVEPRRKRVEFLEFASADLGLHNVRVFHGNIQKVTQKARYISARAVAPLPELFDWTSHIVSRETRFLLPRGENAVSDLEIARRHWKGTFHVEQSLTEATAGIIIADDVAQL